MGAEACASTITRSPICAYCLTIFSTRTGRGFKTNSGAPIANVPTSPKVTAESLRAEEKGRTAVACKAVECPNRSYRAMEVWLLSPSDASMEPRISSTEYSVGLLSSMQSLTFIRPSVIVPVLSRHSTLTRASISRE